MPRKPRITVTTILAHSKALSAWFMIYVISFLFCNANIYRFHIAVCMIEHDFNFISELCDPVIVLAEGSVLFKGTAKEVKMNEEVIESYLGKGVKK